MAEASDKSQVALREVEVRVTGPPERRHRDEPMDRRHYLGLRRFAGRRLRHVVMCRGR